MQNNDFNKQQIIEYLKNHKTICCRIYNSLKELSIAENYAQNGNNYDDVESYTDYAISPENYLAVNIEGNIFPDNTFGSNEMFIEFNAQNQPTGYYLFTSMLGFDDFFEKLRAAIKKARNS